MKENPIRHALLRDLNAARSRVFSKREMLIRNFDSFTHNKQVLAQTINALDAAHINLSDAMAGVRILFDYGPG